MWQALGYKCFTVVAINYIIFGKIRLSGIKEPSSLMHDQGAFIMKRKIKEYIIFTFGTLLIACGIYFFKFPNHLSTGGISGAAVVLNYLFPAINAGSITGILNVSLLLIGIAFIGKSFSFKTVYCSLLLSGFLLILEKTVTLPLPLTNQPVLELCFAILFSTIGEALLLNYDASSGGTDIIAMILKKYTYLSIGKALFIADVIIVVTSGLCYGIQVGMLSFLGLIAKSILLDKIIEQLNMSVSCILITNQADIIRNYIIKGLKRGATIVDCNGGFTGYQKKIIITVIKGFQLYELKKYITRIDKEAFLITSKTSDIYGKGFHALI